MRFTTNDSSPWLLDPDLYHQRLSGKLDELLLSFVQSRQLGEVLYAPVDVVMADDNVAQPDLLFIATEISVSPRPGSKAHPTRRRNPLPIQASDATATKNRSNTPVLPA